MQKVFTYKIGFQDPIDKLAAVTQVQQLHAATLVQCEVNTVTLEVQYTNSTVDLEIFVL